MKYKRVLLKLSGESLKCDSELILSPKFIKNVAEQIIELSSSDVQIGIVIGGGNIWRGRVAEELSMERESSDWMGMLSTVINSLSLASVLKGMGQKTLVMNSFQIDNCGEILNPSRAKKLLEKNTVIIFGAGTGMTHLSTDTAAAMRAKDIDAEIILMAKNNTDGVFDKDPNKSVNAKHFETISYSEIKAKNLTVIDLEAIELLIKSKIKTLVFDLNKENSIINSIKGNNKTTIIH